MRKRKLTIAVAESCTGGLISSSLTDIPGSSGYMAGGVIVYSNRAKTRLLSVPADVILKYGAVSEQTALAMARNVRRLFKTDIGLSVTGVAGPGGGSALKPVGTVFISISLKNQAYFKKFHFRGTRRKIKKRSQYAAFELLKECLN